jgi:putative ABC transport system permease protein
MVLRGAFAQNRLRAALAVLAIALGVALGYAVQLINAAAVNELAQGVKTLSGDADFEVRGPRGGFPESIYPAIARLAGVAVASPIVEVDAKIAGRDAPLRIIGVDVFRAGYLQPGMIPTTADRLDTLRPDVIFLSPAAARFLGVAVGDTVRLQVALRDVTLRVAGGARGGGQPALRPDGHRRRARRRSIGSVFSVASTCDCGQASHRKHSREHCGRCFHRASKSSDPRRRLRRAPACRDPIA